MYVYKMISNILSQVVGVQRGSTRILLRCLPAGLPPPEVQGVGCRV